MMELKRQIAAAQPLTGAFLKTPHYSLVEVMALTKLDFLILDAEHSPFSTTKIDRCILAGKAARLPILVRLPEDSAKNILQVLDMGAAGIIVPHVQSPEQAQRIVQHTRYLPEGRGFAGTHRAGGYGTVPLQQHIENAQETVVIMQIEDRAALPRIEEIAATSGVDACFIGRADLSVSMGHGGTAHPEVEAASQAVIQACARHGIASAIYTDTAAEARAWRDRGVQLIIQGSEHKAILAHFAKV